MVKKRDKVHQLLEQRAKALGDLRDVCITLAEAKVDHTDYVRAYLKSEFECEDEFTISDPDNIVAQVKEAVSNHDDQLIAVTKKPSTPAGNQGEDSSDGLLPEKYSDTEQKETSSDDKLPIPNPKIHVADDQTATPTNANTPATISQQQQQQTSRDLQASSNPTAPAETVAATAAPSFSELAPPEQDETPVEEIEEAWPLRRSWIQVLLMLLRGAVNRDSRVVGRIVEEKLRDGSKFLSKSWLESWLAVHYPVETPESESPDTENSTTSTGSGGGSSSDKNDTIVRSKTGSRTSSRGSQERGEGTTPGTGDSGSKQRGQKEDSKKGSRHASVLHEVEWPGWKRCVFPWSTLSSPHANVEECNTPALQSL